MSFTTIKNGVDERLTIIRHNDSGFYNITKTATLIHQLKQNKDTTVGTDNSRVPHQLKQNEAARDSVQPTRGPQIYHWFSNKDTTQLFAAMSKYLNEPVKDLKFEISGGPNEYRGTYVHPKLYDHFVAWLDKDYAVLISIILEKFHSDANQKIIEQKDCKIDELSKKIDQQSEEARKRDEEQQRKLDDQTKTFQDTLKQFQEEAKKQRAEILQETKAAHDETKLARQDISDLHITVVDHHAQMMDMAEHASVSVKPAKRQYFAITSYKQVGDDTGKIHFRLWRSQLPNMMKCIIDALTNPSTDGDENEYTAHQLVVPPIYCPGAVNIGNAGVSKMKEFLSNTLSILNNGKKRKDKILISDFKESIGLVIGSIHLVWVPNDYIDHGRFVDFFLDQIKNTKIVKLSVMQPKLQSKLDAQANKQYQMLVNQTGKTRENLMDIIEKARTVMKSPATSDEE